MKALLALQRGDEAAWEVAFRLLYPAVFAAARHPLAGLTPSEAEDVAIETLEDLTGQIASVRDWDSLRGLAVTIAARKAISQKRKDTAAKRGSGRVDSIEHLRDESGGAFEPAGVLVERLPALELAELAALLREVMAGLEPLQRDLILGYLVEGISYKELAGKYGVPIGTVGVQLARGLKRIRQVVERKPQILKEMRAYLR